MDSRDRNPLSVCTLDYWLEVGPVPSRPTVRSNGTMVWNEVYITYYPALQKFKVKQSFEGHLYDESNSYPSTVCLI